MNASTPRGKDAPHVRHPKHLHTITCPCGSEHTANKPRPYRYACPDCGRKYRAFEDLILVYPPGDPR